MTTETPPADLLPPLRMVAINIRENLESLPSIAEDWADKLDAAISALAAHRGEVEPFGFISEFDARYLTENITSVARINIKKKGAKRDVALFLHLPQAADGSMTVEDAVNAVAELFPGADKQALRVLARALTKKPQAQAGAGDAWRKLAGVCNRMLGVMTTLTQKIDGETAQLVRDVAEQEQAGELPELPEPASSVALAAWGPKPDYFTADQMHAYANAAILRRAARVEVTTGQVEHALNAYRNADYEWTAAAIKPSTSRQRHAMRAAITAALEPQE